MERGRERLYMQLAASAFGTAAQVTAAFAPVPWLSPAVGILVGILELCQNAETNKRAVRQLGGRCELMLVALKDSSQAAPTGPMANAVQACTNILTDIRNKMIGWRQLGKFKSILLQNEIQDDVKRSNDAISDCCAAFSITAHLEIYNWQTEFEANQGKDQAEVMAFLTDISNQQALMHAAITEQKADIANMMLMMQKALSAFEVGDRRHTDLQTNLYGIQRQSGQLLPDMDLHAGEVRRIGNHPVGGSPAFDIWEGQYLGSEKCAIKVIRGIEVSPNTIKRFYREAKIWRSVWEMDKGEYILQFYGACHTDGPYPYMVSPWMSNGDSLSYVKKYPYVNRKYLIRRIAEGLRLLHSQDPPIAHGDIKAANILINSKGDPLLADFGLSKIMEDITGVPFTQSRGVSDSFRWFAPELCCSPGVLSTHSDVFSYAMTVLELMTGEPPFAHIKRTPEVLIKMQSGERPRKPTGPDVITRGLDDKLWTLLTRCWAQEIEDRPSIHEILEELPQA